MWPGAWPHIADGGRIQEKGGLGKGMVIDRPAKQGFDSAAKFMGIGMKKLTRLERKRLMDLVPADLQLPDFAVLTYAVCVMDKYSCGWGGWLSEGVFLHGAHCSIANAKGDTPLPSVTNQICPNCGLVLFRTDSGQLFIRSVAAT
jgi:hypothetical protein